MRVIKRFSFFLSIFFIFDCGSIFIEDETKLQEISKEEISYEVVIPEPPLEIIDIVEITDIEKYEFTECKENEECITGFCVEDLSGKKVCAPVCLEEKCPLGWECKQVQGLGGDWTFVCFPNIERLCKPCISNEDCTPQNIKTNDICILFNGEEGSFCGKDCTENLLCPEEYECKDIEISGKKYKQCLPHNGKCKCTEEYILNKFKTKCYKQNNYGKCEGERVCMEGGLSPCSAGEPQKEICDNNDNNCNGIVDEGIEFGECEKKNNYGTCKGKEICEGGKIVCNAIEPQEEKCDGIDNNCDGKTDDEESTGCINYYIDKDGDGVGVLGEKKCLCAAEGKYKAIVAGDCNDNDIEVYPNAIEKCDEKDNDCDKKIDEEAAAGCIDYYKDSDNDGFGAVGDKKCLCKEDGEYKVTQAGDCNDNDPSINNSGNEKCNGIDDDCNGFIDEENSEGCIMHYYDEDGDKYGLEENKKCLCAPQGFYSATKPKDCNDKDANVYPDNVEKCNNKDDNCDGKIDEEGAEGCSLYFRDNDGDSFGAKGDFKCLCAPFEKYSAKKTEDCDDFNKEIYPGAIEKCNGYDDNCDGKIDEEGTSGCSDYYYDGDEDGFGISADKKCLCSPQGKWSAKKGGDCNDEDKEVFPTASEKCNGKDDNCDNTIDEESAIGCETYYFDNDTDGYGDSNKTKCLCKGEGKYTALKGGDCNDEDKEVFPTASEKCNGKDDNCDKEIDNEGSEGCIVYYYDGDSDSYGLINNSKCLCNKEGKWTALEKGDCNDNDWSINPGAKEICDGTDNNCNNLNNEGFQCQKIGEEQSQGCGKCGNQKRVCQNNCEWSGWGQCTGEGVCAPNDQQNQPCGKCGKQYRTCTSLCNWGDWGQCQGEGQCYPNEKQQQSCGKCGKQDRTCQDNCYWGNWGNCYGEGVCYPNEKQQQSCGKCGKQEKTCLDNCQWSNWGNCYGEGVCYPNEKTWCGDGCQAKVCQYNCQWGSCGGATYCGGNSSKGCFCDSLCVSIGDCCADVCPVCGYGKKKYYYDFDNDGYGTSSYKDLCQKDGYYRAEKGGDCDDNNISIYPGATEVCNIKDDDCDGSTDEGFDKWPNSWPGNKIGEYPSSSVWYGDDSITPPGDNDYMYVKATEQSKWCAGIKCKAKLASEPSGTNLYVCACWSKIGGGQCDIKGWVCNSAEVTVELPENGCIWPGGNGSTEQGYCDIRVYPSYGASCSNYWLNINIWE